MEKMHNPITIFLTLCFIWVQLSNAESQDSPIVETKYGKVRGVKTKDHYEFRKIPFAKPPIGALRFKPPEEPTPWGPATLLADGSFPEYCIQYNVFWNTTEGVEDCLYVNVFTPDPTPGEGELLPVMVYIHSGGFMFGRGSHFRGDYLMETRKVVAVVFQYRLGSFGFLNTEDEESYGNMGMKDQVLALKFVQENIQNFGGDKKQVMIFGTSAGAASVHYHILSPRSKGLFYAAFSGSGTALCPWAFQRNPKESAIRLGEILNCPTQDSKNLVACLREKDADEIGFAHSKLLQWLSDPIAAFGPSLEVGNPNPETRFILEHPADVIHSGNVNPVPWILGFNADEGYEHSLSIFSKPDELSKLNTKWEELYPITFEYVHEPSEQKQKISQKIRDFYFQGEQICQKNFRNLSNAYSDKTYVLCTVRSAFRHAQLGLKSHPIYLFNFNYNGTSSIVTLRGFSRSGFGPNHMDDIQYLINCPLFKFIDDESVDKPFQKKYIELITEFAKTGKMPAFSKDRPTDIWQPLDPGGSVKWYHITKQPEMEPMSESWKKRMNFWNEFDLQEYKIRSGSDFAKDEL